ncbi:MAG: DsbA family protein [Chloroflexi bacterium]|nr:DsbA family protein [Chloroflexota bacterium]
MSKIRTHTATRTKSAAPATISPLMIGIVVGVVVILVGGLIVIGNWNNNPTSPVDINQFPAMGQANAPVTIVAYSDYRCPHCRDFDRETFPKIEDDFVNTGKVRYVVAPFHLWPETTILTEAALCAGDQGKFFDYGHKMFENQDTLGVNPSSLTDLAAGMGLNRQSFAQCLSNGTHRAAVEEATRAALNQGVSSTPTFFINNQRVEGNQPYEEFKRIIEQELAQAQ